MLSQNILYFFHSNTCCGISNFGILGKNLTNYFKKKCFFFPKYIVPVGPQAALSTVPAALLAALVVNYFRWFGSGTAASALWPFDNYSKLKAYLHSSQYILAVSELLLELVKKNKSKYIMSTQYYTIINIWVRNWVRVGEWLRLL